MCLELRHYVTWSARAPRTKLSTRQHHALSHHVERCCMCCMPARARAPALSLRRCGILTGSARRTRSSAPAARAAPRACARAAGRGGGASRGSRRACRWAGPGRRGRRRRLGAAGGPGGGCTHRQGPSPRDAGSERRQTAVRVGLKDPPGHVVGLLRGLQGMESRSVWPRVPGARGAPRAGGRDLPRLR